MGYESGFMKTRGSQPSVVPKKSAAAAVHAEPARLAERVEQTDDGGGIEESEAPSSSTVSTGKYVKSLSQKDWVGIRAKGMGQWKALRTGVQQQQQQSAEKELTLSVAFRRNMSSLDASKLSLVDVGITSITALRAELLLKVKVLFLSNNNISSLNSLESYRALEVLSITNNMVRYTHQLQPLAQLPNLVRLSVLGNPVVEMPYFRDRLLALCPRLEALDGVKISAREREAAKATSGMAAVVSEQLEQNELRNLILRHLSVQTRFQVLLLRQVCGHFAGVRNAQLPTADEGTDACMDRTGTILRRLLSGGTFYWLQIGCQEHLSVLMQELAHKAHSVVAGRLEAPARAALLRSPRALTKHWDGVNAQIAAVQQDQWVDLIRACEAHRDDVAAFYTKGRAGVDPRPAGGAEQVYLDAGGADARQTLESITFLPLGDAGRDSDRHRLYSGGAGPSRFPSRTNPIRARQHQQPQYPQQQRALDHDGYSDMAYEQLIGEGGEYDHDHDYYDEDAEPSLPSRAAGHARGSRGAKNAATRVTYGAISGMGLGLDYSASTASDNDVRSSSLMGAGKSAAAAVAAVAENTDARYRALLRTQLRSSEGAGARGHPVQTSEDEAVLSPRPSPPPPMPLHSHSRSLHGASGTGAGAPIQQPSSSSSPRAVRGEEALAQRAAVRQSFPPPRPPRREPRADGHMRASADVPSSSSSSVVLKVGFCTRAAALEGTGPALDLKAVQAFIARVAKDVAEVPAVAAASSSSPSASTPSGAKAEGSTIAPFQDDDDDDGPEGLRAALQSMPLPAWIQSVFDLDTYGPPIAVPRRVSAVTIARGATGGKDTPVDVDELRALADARGLGVRQLQERVEDLSTGLSQVRGQWLTASGFHSKLRKRAESLRERTRKGAAAAVDRLKCIQVRVHAAHEEVELGGAWVGRTGAVLRQLDLEREKVAAAKGLLLRLRQDTEDCEQATAAEAERRVALVASATDLAEAMLDVDGQIDSSPGLKRALAEDKLRAKASLLARYLCAIKRRVFRQMRSRVLRQIAIKSFAERQRLSFRIRATSVCFLGWMRFIECERRRGVAVRWVVRGRELRYLNAWKGVFVEARRVAAFRRARVRVQGRRYLKFWRACAATARACDGASGAYRHASQVADSRRVTGFYVVRCFRAWRRFAAKCTLPLATADRLAGRASRHHKSVLFRAWRHVAQLGAAWLRRRSALLERRLTKRHSQLAVRLWSASRRASRHGRRFTQGLCLARFSAARKRRHVATRSNTAAANWAVRRGLRTALLALRHRCVWARRKRQALRTLSERRRGRSVSLAWRAWTVEVRVQRSDQARDVRALVFFMRRLSCRAFNGWAMVVGRSKALRARYLQPRGGKPEELWVLAEQGEVAVGHHEDTHVARRPPLPPSRRVPEPAVTRLPTGQLRVSTAAAKGGVSVSIQTLGLELYQGRYQAVNPLCGGEWDSDDDVEDWAWRGPDAAGARIRAHCFMARWRRRSRRRIRLRTTASLVVAATARGSLRRAFTDLHTTFMRAHARALARYEARFSPADAPEGAGDLSDDVMKRMDSQAEALSRRVQERRTEIGGLRQAVERLDDVLGDGLPDYEQAQMAARSRDVAEGQLHRQLDEGRAEVARLRDGVASSKALLGGDGELGLAATQKEAEEAEAALRFGSVAEELARGEENKEELLGNMSLAYELAVTRQSEAQARIRRMRAQRSDAKKAAKRARGQLATVEEQLGESCGRQAQLEGVLSQCRHALFIANERVTGDADRHAEDMRGLLSEEQAMRSRRDKARRRTDALIGQLNGVRTEVAHRRRALEDARDELRYNPALTEVAAVALVEAGQAAIDTSARHLAHLEHASDLRATELTSHSRSTAAMRDPHRSSSSRVIGQAGHSVDIGVDIENENVQLRSQRIHDVVSERGRKQPSNGVSTPLGLHARATAASAGRNRRSVKRETDPATTSSSSNSSSDADASMSLSISLDAADVVKGSALDHTFESASSMLSVSLTGSEEDKMDLEITAIEDRIRSRLASSTL